MKSHYFRYLALIWFVYTITSAFDTVGQTFPANTFSVWDAFEVVIWFALAFVLGWCTKVEHYEN